MPLFEYKCESCDNRFEELVSGDNPKVVCPNCRSEKVAKQLSVFSAGGGSTSSSLPCGQSSCGSGFS